MRTWLTYKANATWAVDSTHEVEVTTSSAEDTIALLKAMDVPLIRTMEHKRQAFKLGDISFDLDRWPLIPMVLEIEAPAEAGVRKGAELLGLEWGDAIFEDQLVVHKKYFNVDLFKITDYRFPA